MNADLYPYAAAFIGGAATSLHCVGMCGPLVCAVRCQPARYHLTRTIAYTAVGGVAGLLGAPFSAWLDQHAFTPVTWVMVIIMLLLASGLESRIPQPAWASRLLLRARLDQSLGWLTPLLPCGPLWLMIGAAVATAHPASGAILLLCFALGTIPLAWLAQAGFAHLAQRSSHFALQVLRRGFALIAAAVLIWRATAPFHACCH